MPSVGGPSPRAAHGILWLLPLASWQLVEGASATIEVGAPEGYVDAKATLPLCAPWSDAVPPPARIRLEREPGAGVVEARFVGADERPLPPPLEFGFGLADLAGRWRCKRHVRLGDRGDPVELVVRGGETYREYVRSGSRMWAAPPVYVPRDGRTTWTLRLTGSFARIRFECESDGNRMFAPVIREGWVAHSFGEGPIRPREMAPGESEGVRVPLCLYRIGHDAWLIGPVEPGPRAFAFDVPGFVPVTATHRLDPGLVNEVVVRLRPHEAR